METVQQRGLFDEGEVIQPTLFGETPKKVLIEGGFQDDWGRLHSVHPTELLIPDSVTRINVRGRGSSYVKHLTWVGTWIDQYVMPTQKRSQTLGEEYNLFDYDVLQAVSSVIVELDRDQSAKIFFDTSLLDDSSENNRNRLDRYLAALKEKNEGMNPIHMFFTEQGRKRIRFRGDVEDTRNMSPIEIYNV